MNQKQQILDCLYAAVDEINDQLPPDGKLAKDEAAELFGRTGKLDSLGLVTFIVAAEQRLADAFPVPVALADEKAMSQQNSPFRTIATLAGYIQQQLHELIPNAS